ncbi:MAG: Trk system potassium transporter TrkA [Syntrophomonadaceae bacterium]|nr:Trk system potassium transporter TrkA [Syntrophomonadaceae bacterium]
MQVIIVGAGKVGFNLAQMLSSEHDVLVIEKNDERREIIGELLDIQTLNGNGASPAVLREANIRGADMLIAVTEMDEINMVACMVAKQFGVPRTVARVRNPEYTEGPHTDISYANLGIDMVINPEQVTAREIAKLIEVPEALNVEYYAEGRIQMVEVKIGPQAPVIGKKLKELNIPNQCLIACILRNNSMTVARGEDMIQNGDLVFIIVRTRDTVMVEKIIGKQMGRTRSITILGAGRTSYYLTDYLLKKKFDSVKVIEKDRTMAKYFAQRMPEALIINGDGTDPALLNEENIGKSDVFVAITDDDKINLLVSLLAKNLGVKKTITQVRRSDYSTLIEQVGIDIAISPRLLTAEAILRFIRRGNIVSVTLLEGDKAEVLELIVPFRSRVANRSLRQINLPMGTLVGAIRRKDEVIIPRGSDIIKPGDQVMVFTLPQYVSTIEKFFQNNGGK